MFSCVYFTSKLEKYTDHWVSISETGREFIRKLGCHFYVHVFVYFEALYFVYLARITTGGLYFPE